ncbi:MAG: TIGR03086 family metal-binding protein [Mycobacteriales bacterium]
MTSEPVDQLSLALDVAEQVIAAVREEQWTAPTPCPDWSVRDLTNHLVTGNALFASLVAGAPPPAPQEAVRAGDLLSAYRESAAALLAAFRQPGALERVVTVPFGTVPGMVALHLRITEVLVHGWDVARATGQPATFPGDVAEAELTFSRGALADIPADRKPFAAPQRVADDAPAIDRLAACLGRSVTN